MNQKKVILVIRDGWGVKEKKGFFSGFFAKKNYDAIKLSKTPNNDIFLKKYPNILLEASGEAVGLPDGYIGNSEVGHITLGAGRILKQSLLRINENIEKGDFFKNKKIHKSISRIKKNNNKLHLIILMQDAGVHSHINHLFAVLDFCKKEGLDREKVVLHLITDGRDDDPKSGILFLAKIAEEMDKKNMGVVGTISGRFYAMDRNKNMDRTEEYFKTFFEGEAELVFDCGLDIIDSFYEKDITDEFLPPMKKNGYDGIAKGDSIFFLNFRKDRAIQISRKIEEKIQEYDLYFLSMTRYYNNFKGEVIFEDIEPKNTLGDILEKNNKKQLRISETEKYAHVTFFFDGGVKKEHKGKKNILIKSENIKYDQKPSMNSAEMNEVLLKEVEKKEFDFILVNYPNVDMVAHTGNLKATIEAVETVDKMIGALVKTALKNSYTILITGDHGNGEEVSKFHTSHTKNKVPLILIDNDFENKKEILKNDNYGLANIAPTILKLMNLEKPKEYFEDFLNNEK